MPPRSAKTPNGSSGTARASEEDSWLFDGKVSDTERLSAVEHTLGTAMVKLDTILQRLDKISVVGAAATAAGGSGGDGGKATAPRRASTGEGGAKMTAEQRAKWIEEAKGNNDMEGLIAPVDVLSEPVSVVRKSRRRAKAAPPRRGFFSLAAPQRSGSRRSSSEALT